MLTNENLHYLDNAATTIPSPEVVAAVSKSLAENWANPSSLYTPGLENAQLLNRCRATVAKTLGCTAAEVYFTGCGSESNNIALLVGCLCRRIHHLLRLHRFRCCFYGG